MAFDPLSNAVSVFFKLRPAEKEAFLADLDSRGMLHKIREKAVADARLKNQELRNQIVQLEEANRSLKSRVENRMTRAERKQRILDLAAEGWSAPEIAKIMKQEGENISAGAVRQSLSRLKRSK